mmetsp:Transcript_34805/g.98675  ORF Transcript_34805/g.98675 Transcript_34805/m.98675 type:complete len:215 (+) Transcript_34805:521-1165(+)
MERRVGSGTRAWLENLGGSGKGRGRGKRGWSPPCRSRSAGFRERPVGISSYPERQPCHRSRWCLTAGARCPTGSQCRSHQGCRRAIAAAAARWAWRSGAQTSCTHGQWPHRRRCSSPRGPQIQGGHPSPGRGWALGCRRPLLREPAPCWNRQCRSRSAPCPGMQEGTARGGRHPQPQRYRCCRLVGQGCCCRPQCCRTRRGQRPLVAAPPRWWA